MEEKLEITIINICDWLNGQLDESILQTSESILPEMIKALAELVIAKAHMH